MVVPLARPLKRSEIDKKLETEKTKPNSFYFIAAFYEGKRTNKNMAIARDLRLLPEGSIRVWIYTWNTHVILEENEGGIEGGGGPGRRSGGGAGMLKREDGR